MAKRYSKEWRRNVAAGTRRATRTYTDEQRRKLSEAAKKGNRSRVYTRIPTEELKCPHNVRTRIFEERGRKCEECGWAKPNPFTGIIPVQVDHVDGDRTNNHPDNLKVLCPNCHSLTKKFMFYGGSHRGTWGKKGTVRRR